MFSDPRDATVQLYDTKTGDLIANLRGHTSYMECLAFAPDGKTLASGGWTRRCSVDVPRARLLRHWLDLARRVDESDRAAAVLIQAGSDAMRLLADPLLRAAAVEKKFAKWIDDLGSDDVKRRDKATRELTDAGDTAEFSLGLFLEIPAKADHRKRVSALAAAAASARNSAIDQIIAKLDKADNRQAMSDLMAFGITAEPRIHAVLAEPRGPGGPSQRTRIFLEQAREQIKVSGNDVSVSTPAQALRAVAVVEAIGTPEARRLLVAIAAGAPESNLTRQAAAAVKRIDSSK